jgi:hypothetical protein
VATGEKDPGPKETLDFEPGSGPLGGGTECVPPLSEDAAMTAEGESEDVELMLNIRETELSPALMSRGLADRWVALRIAGGTGIDGTTCPSSRVMLYSDTSLSCLPLGACKAELDRGCIADPKDKLNGLVGDGDRNRVLRRPPSM